MKELIEAWEIKVQSLAVFGSKIEKMCEYPDLKDFKFPKNYIMTPECLCDIIKHIEGSRADLVKEYGILDLESEIQDLELSIINKFRNGYGASIGASDKDVEEYCEHNPLVSIERRDIVYGIKEFIKESVGSKD